MSRFYVPAHVVTQVLADAGHLCGYCHSDERTSGIPLSIEHMYPRAAGGRTERDNLWRSCRTCNERKGSHTTALDIVTGETVPIFNPRSQVWREHFYWSMDGTLIIGQSAIGRATVLLLDLNRELIVAARRRWVEVGWHPPHADVDQPR